MEVKKPSIFISHSSKDLQIARAIRNLLEDRDHHVLLFNLLQTIEESALHALLDEEIKTREWLVLIDSIHSQNSTWVQFEMAKARQYRKTVHVISSSRFKASTRLEFEQLLKPYIDTFSRSLRIFLSYSMKDGNIVPSLATELEKAGYEVGVNMASPNSGLDSRNELEKAINDIMEHGIFMPVISRNSMRSSYVQYEIDYALKQTTNDFIIPIVIGDFSLLDLPERLKRYRYLDLRWESEIGSIEDLLDILNRMRYMRLSAECISFDG